MSKVEKKRRVEPNQAFAVARMLKTSPQKLNMTAKLIRGKKVSDALNILNFSHKKNAIDVKKTLLSAIANAENNHDLDIDSLIVTEAWVGKNIVLKRGRPRGRGRFGRIHKPFSQVTVRLTEIEKVV